MSLLPTEKTPRRDTLTDLTVLLFGEPKIGKSTFCAGLEDAMFISTEPGLNHLEVYQVTVSSWPEFLKICGELRQGEHKFKSVVIDTIDNLYRWCVEFRMEKLNKELEAQGKPRATHISDLPFSKGYDIVNSEFLRVLTGLSLMPFGLWMISHSQSKEVKSRTGQKSEKQCPTLTNSAMKIVNGLVDLILYAEIEEIEKEGEPTKYRRVVRTSPTTLYTAGGRMSGKLPETIPLKFSEFLKCYEAARTK
jgi:hypothetical protein